MKKQGFYSLGVLWTKVAKPPAEVGKMIGRYRQG